MVVASPDLKTPAVVNRQPEMGKHIAQAFNEKGIVCKHRHWPTQNCRRLAAFSGAQFKRRDVVATAVVNLYKNNHRRVWRVVILMSVMAFCPVCNPRSKRKRKPNARIACNRFLLSREIEQPFSETFVATP
jgi:hypothetical protein